MTILEKVGRPEVFPPRIVIHSRGGIGKTTFGASAPNPLFVPYEQGAGILDVKCANGIDDVATSMNLLRELWDTSNHDYNTLVIDTVDHFEPMIWKATCDIKGKDHIEDYGYGKGYALADDFWFNWFDGLTALSRKGMMVIVLAHSADVIMDDPMIGSYTRTVPKLHKRHNKLLEEWADIVGYLDIERVSADVGKDGGRTVRTSRVTGNRVLYLQDMGAFTAKNRYDLPASIPVPKENGFSILGKLTQKAVAKNISKEAA